MKQHLKHIYRSSFPSKETDGIICGDNKNYEYMEDREWRQLPKCEICFGAIDNITKDYSANVNTKKEGLFLRDAL